MASKAKSEPTLCGADVVRCTGCCNTISDSTRNGYVCPKCPEGTPWEPSTCTKPIAAAKVQAGATRCRWHGGNSRQVKGYLERNRLEAKARRAVEVFGAPRNIDPYDALAEEIARFQGHADWILDVIRNLDEDELVWGIVSHEKGVGPEGPIDKVTWKAEQSVWIKLYRETCAHLLALCKASIDAGLADREIAVAEEQVRLMSEAFAAVMAERGASVEEQQEVRVALARHLQALPAA